MTIGLCSNIVIVDLGNILIECYRQKLVDLRKNERKGTEELSNGGGVGRRCESRQGFYLSFSLWYLGKRRQPKIPIE